MNEKGGLHSFPNSMNAEWYNKPVDSSDNRIGVFRGAVAIYLGIFYRQMVNVVTFSPKSCHSKNLSKAILTHFLECFQLTLCSQIAGKYMCAKQSMQSDAHCSVSQEIMLLLIDLQIYKQYKKKLKTKKIGKLIVRVDHLEIPLFIILPISTFFYACVKFLLCPSWRRLLKSCGGPVCF